MTYEALIKKAENQNIEVFERRMSSSLKGLYGDNVVWINANIETEAEKICILAEELGHHYTTSGDILDQKNISNKQQEQRARAWAYMHLIPLEKLVEAYRTGIQNRNELADFLDVPEYFIEAAIIFYKEKYGIYKIIDNYIIYFDPLIVLEKLED